MKDSLILQDKIYISARRVHELFGYTTDYVGQLCRAGKLDSKMIGHSWFVTEQSIRDHLSIVSESIKSKAKEKKARAKKLYQQKLKEAMNKPEASSAVAMVENQDKVLTQEGTVASNFPEKVSVNELPIIETKLEEKIAELEMSSPAVDPTPLMPVPHSFALPFYFSESFAFSTFAEPRKNIITRSSIGKITLATGVMVFALAFYMQSSTMISSLTNFSPINTTMNVEETSSEQIVANVAEVGNKISEVFSVLKNGSKKIFTALFNKEGKTLVHDNQSLNNNQLVDVKPMPLSGMAVIPSSNSDEQDEIIKQRIRDSFSDDVIVTPDKSGTAGIITPVFRKTTGEDFLYVLVPVNNDSSERSN